MILYPGAARMHFKPKSTLVRHTTACKQSPQLHRTRGNETLYDYIHYNNNNNNCIMFNNIMIIHRRRVLNWFTRRAHGTALPPHPSCSTRVELKTCYWYNNICTYNRCTQFY